MSSSSNKKRKQLALGAFFQPKPKQLADGTICQKIIPSIFNEDKKPGHEQNRIKCKAKKCLMTFKTFQGLGSHLNCCHYYKVEQEQELQKGNINIILPPATKDAAGKISNPTFRQMYATVESNMIAVHEDGCDDKNANNNVNTTNQKLRKDGEVDGRKDNWGMSIRTVYTNQEKLTHIERYESWLNEELGKGNVHATVSSYIHKLRLPTKFKIYLSTKGAGWREPERKRSIIDAVTSKLKKNLSVPNRSRLYLPKYPVMERELVKQLKEKRSCKARVSALWI